MFLIKWSEISPNCTSFLLSRHHCTGLQSKLVSKGLQKPSIFISLALWRAAILDVHRTPHTNNSHKNLRGYCCFYWVVSHCLPASTWWSMHTHTHMHILPLWNHLNVLMGRDWKEASISGPWVIGIFLLSPSLSLPLSLCVIDYWQAWVFITAGCEKVRWGGGGHGRER